MVNYNSKAPYTLPVNFFFQLRRLFAFSSRQWRYKAGINNSAVDDGNIVRRANKEHQPPPELLTFCSLLFTSLNSVTLDQSDRSLMMSADTVVKIEATKLAGWGGGGSG